MATAISFAEFNSPDPVILMTTPLQDAFAKLGVVLWETDSGDATLTPNRALFAFPEGTPDSISIVCDTYGVTVIRRISDEVTVEELYYSATADDVLADLLVEMSAALSLDATAARSKLNFGLQLAA